MLCVRFQSAGAFSSLPSPFFLWICWFWVYFKGFSRNCECRQGPSGSFGSDLNAFGHPRNDIYCAAATCFWCSFLNFSTSSSILDDVYLRLGKNSIEFKCKPVKNQDGLAGCAIFQYLLLLLHCWDPPLLRAAFFFGSRLGRFFEQIGCTESCRLAPLWSRSRNF